MVRIASTFNDLTREEAVCLDCLEVSNDINNIKTNKLIAVRLDCNENLDLDYIAEILKEKNCFNIILDNVKIDDLKNYKNAIEKKIRGARISLTANGDISKLIEIAQEYDISYIYDPYMFEESLQAFKKLKKRISFIMLNEKDNYGYDTMCGSTPRSKELIKYIVKKNIDSIIVINSNMNEYIKLRSIYLKRNVFKKILPTKLNKSMKVFNYMINNKKDIDLFNFNKLEYKYIEKLTEEK